MYLSGLNEVSPLTMNDKDIDELILKSIRLKKKLAIAKALEGLYWIDYVPNVILHYFKGEDSPTVENVMFTLNDDLWRNIPMG